MKYPMKDGHLLVLVPFLIQNVEISANTYIYIFVQSHGINIDNIV